MTQLKETDPFFERMFARMSPGAKYLFSPYQLDEIKKAFSARSFGAHVVDIRLSFRFLRNAYYVVLLVGRERRLHRRTPVDISRLSSLAALAAVAIGGYLLFAYLP